MCVLSQKKVGKKLKEEEKIKESLIMDPQLCRRRTVKSRRDILTIFILRPEACLSFSLFLRLQSYRVLELIQPEINPSISSIILSIDKLNNSSIIQHFLTSSTLLTNDDRANSIQQPHNRLLSRGFISKTRVITEIGRRDFHRICLLYGLFNNYSVSNSKSALIRKDPSH